MGIVRCLDDVAVFAAPIENPIQGFSFLLAGELGDMVPPVGLDVVDDMVGKVRADEICEQPGMSPPFPHRLHRCVRNPLMQQRLDKGPSQVTSEGSGKQFQQNYHYGEPFVCVTAERPSIGPASIGWVIGD